MKKSGVVFISGPTGSGKSLLSYSLCHKALQAGGNIWTLDEGEMRGLIVRLIQPRESFNAGFIGDPRKYKIYSVPQSFPFLDSALRSMNSLSEDQLEQATLLLSMICESSKDPDFLLAELRAVLLEVQSLQLDRYSLSHIVEVLKTSTHPDLRDMGETLRRKAGMPNKYIFAREFSPENNLSIYTIPNSERLGDNSLLKTLKLCTFMTSIADLMQTGEEKSLPQICVIDDQFQNIKADKKIISRLLSNLSKAVEKANGLLLITTQEENPPIDEDRIIRLNLEDDRAILRASGGEPPLDSQTECMAAQFLKGYLK